MCGQKEIGKWRLARVGRRVNPASHELEKGRGRSGRVGNAFEMKPAGCNAEFGSRHAKRRILAHHLPELKRVGIPYALIDACSRSPYESIREKAISKAGSWLKGLVVLFVELTGAVVHVPSDTVVHGEPGSGSPLVGHKEGKMRQAASIAR